MSHTRENLFLGTLPKRLILWCIDNDAYNGEYSKNPFNAKNNAINFLAVYVDGRQVQAKPLQPNSETGCYIRSYVNLFSATGKQSQDEGNGLSRDGQGYTFFGFDLTPDGCDGGCFHLTRKGNLRIEMHFATAPTPTCSGAIIVEAFRSNQATNAVLQQPVRTATMHVKGSFRRFVASFYTSRGVVLGPSASTLRFP